MAGMDKQGLTEYGTYNFSQNARVDVTPSTINTQPQTLHHKPETGVSVG